MNFSKRQVFLIFFLVVLAVLGRWLPHPPNFTPVIALALFAGAYLRSPWLAGLVPFVAMLVSDIFLGFHNLTFVTYPALILLAIFATRSKLEKNNLQGWSSLVGFGIGGAVWFFLTSNFAVWAFTGMYPGSFSGLMSSYVAGIPFFQYSLGSTLLYGVVIKSVVWAADKFLVSNPIEA